MPKVHLATSLHFLTKTENSGSGLGRWGDYGCFYLTIFSHVRVSICYTGIVTKLVKLL